MRFNARKGFAILATGALLFGASTTAAEAATKHPLGPKGYNGVRLGMNAKQVKATKKVRRTMSGYCSSYAFKAHKAAGKHTVDLYLSRKHGVVMIFAWKGIKTPRGIHLGSTKAQVKKAYPKLKTGIDYSYAPVPGNTKAQYIVEFAHGKVYELALALKNQDCAN